MTAPVIPVYFMIFSRLILLIILSVASLPCFSQIVLVGKVLNQQEEPLPFTDVKLCRQTDSGVVLTVQTDTAGNFILHCANSPGNNYVAVSRLGYMPAYRSIDAAEKDTAKWDVVLKNETNLLNDVTISSKAPLLERKVDRTVFNVANSIAANGADVYELLKKTPGVQVTNGSISITGKSTVSIMVNDKLVQIDADEMESFLRSMPAGDIWQVTNLYNATYQNSYFDNRLLRVALTWKFGNKNIQAKRERDLNTDEMKRAS